MLAFAAVGSREMQQDLIENTYLSVLLTAFFFFPFLFLGHRFWILAVGFFYYYFYYFWLAFSPFLDVSWRPTAEVLKTSAEGHSPCFVWTLVCWDTFKPSFTVMWSSQLLFFTMLLTPLAHGEWGMGECDCGKGRRMENCQDVVSSA